MANAAICIVPIQAQNVPGSSIVSRTFLSSGGSDRMHGLDTCDYGARQYDPVLGRWDRADPLCEKYYDVSPYAYCHNNPVIRIDPNGEYDFVGINNNQYYPVIAVFPQNEIGIKGAIQNIWKTLNMVQAVCYLNNIYMVTLCEKTFTVTLTTHQCLLDSVNMKGQETWRMLDIYKVSVLM